MLKNRVISILIMCTCGTQVLMADSFNKFLNTALKESPYLKSTYLGKEQLRYEASIATRYENPDLDISYAKFNPKNEVSDTGYGVSISQPIRFWSISKDKEKLSQKILHGAKNFYQLDKANFIKKLSLLYTNYEFSENLKELTQESFKIAKEIYDISKERYTLGSISQADLLQTEVALMEIQVQNENAKIESLNQYYNLLKFSGITEKIDLELNHTFNVKRNKGVLSSPELLAMKSKQDINLARLDIESNTFDSINISVGYDDEPDQTVNRFGISIPFPLFNTRSQETKIAVLESKKNNLLIENRTKQLEQELIQMYKVRESLQSQLNKYTNILKTKNQLLEMYIEKYKISQASILELQSVKNSVIQTKKEFLQIKLALNENAITLNYIQGDINEETIID